MSQTLTWNNQPNPLEFKIGETLSINISYDTDGNSFNYIWLKLQKRNSSNNIIEDHNSIFYNGTNPVPNSDTINLSYTIPDNIALSSELSNGDHYYFLFTMWTSAGWTSLNLQPTITGNTGLHASGGTTNVYMNLNVNHVIENISEFDRSKFITIHANQSENEWNNDNEIDDVRNDFLNGLDVYMGRETGGITWHLSRLNQDPQKPGFVNHQELINKAVYWRNLYAQNTEIHPYENKNNLIIGAQLHPFWTGEGQQATAKGWKFANATAVGDYMGLYIKEFHKENGQPKPAFIEVINEPAYERLGGPAEYNNTLEDIAEFHNEVADGIKTHLPDAKVGGYTTAFPNFEKGDFKRWNNRWKLFMDIAGAKMDFWSIHLYDWPSVNNGQKQFRSGGNVEATFDLMEQYSMLKFGVAKPFVISEYGAQMNDYNKEQWSSFRDWLHVRSSNSLLMSFIDRPNLIASVINFIIVKAEWGFADGVPYNHRLMRKKDEPTSYTGDWIYTDMVKFYQLWSDVKGKRIDTTSDNLDIQIDGFVDDNKAYVIINNLNFADEIINLNIFGNNNNTITSIQKKQVYLDGTNTIFENLSLDADTKSVILKSEATLILTYTFTNSIQIDETSRETKYYATDYLKPIIANETINFSINNVQKSNFGEAVLRIGLGRQHNLSLKPTVTLNGKNIEVPNNWRGDNQYQRERFFGLLEIPVSFDDLQENNQISVKFADNGGHISTITMQVYEFSKNIRNVNLSTRDYSTKKAIQLIPNPTVDKLRIKNLTNYNKINIYNSNGKKLKTFFKGDIINIKDLNKGVYFLKTDTGYYSKLIKM